MRKNLVLFLLGLLGLGGSIGQAAPLGTAFTYQGRLDQNNQPAPNGIYQMTFWLYAASSGGNSLASNEVQSITMTNGLFVADVDFGANVFTGDERWLAITMRTNNNAAPFVLLSPRTRLTPTPNAIFASTAGAVTNGGIYVTQLKTTTAPSPGQVLGYNGSSMVWQNVGATSPFLLSGSSAYYNGGNVGVGTTTPSTYGHGGTAKILEVNNGGTAANSQAHLMLFSGVNSFSDSSIGTVTWAQPGGMAAFIAAHTRSTTPNVPAANLILGTRNIGDAAAQTRMVIGEDGNVGIGSINPGAKLEVVTATGNGVAGYSASAADSGVYGQNNGEGIGIGGRTGGRGIAVYGDNRNPAGWAGLFAGNVLVDEGDLRMSAQRAIVSSGRLHIQAGEDLYLNPYAGAGIVYVGGGGGPGTLHVVGSASVCTLTIRGGCDLAEPFPMKEEQIEKGSVVVIDEEHPGRLKLSTRAYDMRVAGIVSGANGINPGIALKQEGALDQGENVALTGRVYVKADASFGAIKPGDLLTTSDTRGHAMKVTDHAKAQGAILGKAMSALAEGKGLVLVLVTLQ